MTRTLDPVPFLPSTHWTSIAAAGEERPRLGVVLRRYEPSLFGHLQRRFHLSPHDAQDVLQQFFTDAMLERNLLRLADRARGRFRSFLLTALDHHTRNWLRDRSTQKRSPGAMADLDAVPPPADGHPAPDQAFQVTWAREVIAQAVERMRVECQADGQSQYWELFRARVLGPVFDGSAGEPYAGLVQRLGFATPAQAANALVTAKRHFARTLRAVVVEYLTDPSHADEEIADLQRILSGPGA
jgi:RNA polymerase sigma-70 factor (ECF subfamily)